TRADSYLNLGTLFVAGGRFEDALECFERAFKHDPQMPGVRSRLAWQMSERGKVKRAEDLFRQSLSMNPEGIEGWLGLGHVLEDLGEAEGARNAYLNVLRRRPDHAVAMSQYLALLRDEADDSALWLARAEQSLRDDRVRDEAKALIGYGVAKYHDRRSHYRAAAEAGLIANAARRRIAGPMDREALRARVDRLIDTYTPDSFRERRRFGSGTDQPVFIVGLPRSGTTLTEQILAAHPLMHGAGELPTLGRLAATVAGSMPLWQAASLLDESSSREIAGKYLRTLRDGAQKGVLRISDKTPLNYFQLAFACLLFPAARVIHCRRSAHDNALSIWMENFAADQRYATDFDDLAFFRAEYERLMAHWRRVLPLQMIDLQYEETVADLNSQARRLIDFLGAPWDDGCLNFHSSSRTVQTPSRWQVRQPIYSSSVQRWQAYAEYLPDLSGGTDCSAATE
ncbi:MAG TPA: sulfotransferase, partial [Steroidobacter sp.]